MVVGIESFREKFSEYADCYTVIGGAACDIIMGELDFEFRATKDIDMILIMEDKFKEFASVFWEYIREGEYKCGWKNSLDMHFYRFTEPKQGYPFQIELFSRDPGYYMDIQSGIIPVYIDEDTLSLSAILLNDEYYNFMLKGRKQVNGISVLGPEYLIPFKMFAWLDLTKRKESGEHVNEKDLKKHKYDVFRLLQIITNDTNIEVQDIVKDNIIKFLEAMSKEHISLSQMQISFEMDQALNLLKAIYGV